MSKVKSNAFIPEREDTYFAPKGWICPKCGASLSPSTSFCPFCAPSSNYPSTTGEFTDLTINKSYNYDEEGD